MPSERSDRRRNDRHALRGFLLRLPEDLLDAAKTRAAEEGRTTTDLMIRALREYLR